MDVERCMGTIVSIPFNEHTISAHFDHVVTNKEHLENKPVILRLHGTLGNLLDEAEHFLPCVLASKGYSSLTVNTLMANLGLFFGFGLFDKALLQIDTAYNFLREMGFKKIIIAGHGLGSCMAIRYGALRNDPVEYPGIMGVIGITTPYSMPETVRRRWERFGSVPSYDEVHRKAKRIFKPDPGEEPAQDEIVLINKGHGDTCHPEHAEIYTLKTWWALAGPEAEEAMVYRHIGDIKVPLLLIRGLRDKFVEHREFEDLAQIARDSGNRDVTQVCLDANHNLDGKHDELGTEIIKWISDRFEDEEI